MDAVCSATVALAMLALPPSLRLLRYACCCTAAASESKPLNDAVTEVVTAAMSVMALTFAEMAVTAATCGADTEMPVQALRPELFSAARSASVLPDPMSETSASVSLLEVVKTEKTTTMLPLDKRRRPGTSVTSLMATVEDSTA
jgi:hypothetical protein